MASSLTGTQFASITSSSYSSLSWIGSYTLQSQDPITNKSVLRLYGSLRNTNEYGYSYGSDYSTLKVNNVTVYDSSYRAYAGYEVMGYTDLTVTHNADGTFPSQSISISAYSYHFSSQSATGTISGLPSLDRVAPTVTVSLASRTSNSLTINATASANCDYWEFSRDDGSTFPYTSSTEGTAVSYTFTGLSPNTTYNIKVRARKKVNQLKGTSARGAYTTIGNALLNSVAEVYADASTVIIKPNMTVYGASFTYTLEIKRGSTSILTLTIPAQSTGTKDVSVTLTSTQRTTLLSGMSNVASFSATYILKTLNNGTQVGSTSSATATIRTSSSTSAPSQASFSYADTNAATVAVTGDSTKLIQGQSTLRLTSLTATAKNGASIASYNITIGGVTKSVTSGGTVDIGTISQSGTLSLSVVVTDSRGYTSTKTQSITCYAYSPPSISAYSVKRNASTSTQIDMSFSGTFSNIGSNTVTAKYKYKQSTAGSYSAETSVTPTTSGGTFSYSGTNVATFDDEYVYDFVITIADGIITETYYMTVPSYNPLIAFRPNAVGFGMIPQHTKSVEIAQDWRFEANGKFNRIPYTPYSFNAVGVQGTAGYARIARVTVGSSSTASYAQQTIHFHGIRRVDVTPFDIYFALNGASSDPPLASITAEFPQYVTQPALFEAFAYKVATGTWDIYVRKCSGTDQITVFAYVGAYAQNYYNVTFSDNLLTSVPDTATVATQKPIINTARLNQINYLPYTARVRGAASTAGYARIALITVTGNRLAAPFTFWVDRLFDDREVEISFRLNNDAGTDPTLAAIYYDARGGTYTTRQFSAFAYKEGTSQWGIYVNKSHADDRINVRTYIPPSSQEKVEITYTENLLSSVPSGAVMATVAPCLTSTVTITKTSGNSTASSVQFYRSGNVCHLSFNLTTSASTSVGSNVFVGTTNAPKPVRASMGATYNSSTALITEINAQGSVYVRVTGATLASGATPYCSVIYLTNE